MRKAKAQNLEEGDIVIENDDERSLALKLLQFGNIIFRAHEEKEPSVITDYAYTLAQNFSNFYNTCPIMTAQTAEIAASRLKLARLVRDMLKQLLYLLGIEAPEAMLKA